MLTHKAQTCPLFMYHNVDCRLDGDFTPQGRKRVKEEKKRNAFGLNTPRKYTIDFNNVLKLSAPCNANVENNIGEELVQTSPGTLYFFITIPVSQSITQRESPPQVATKRLSPPAPAQKTRSFKRPCGLSDQSEGTVCLNLIDLYQLSPAPAGKRRPTAG